MIAMNTDYQIWIAHQGKQDMLPVNPEKYEVSCGSNNKVVDIAGLGEIVLTEAPKAEVISFSSFLPNTQYSSKKPFSGYKSVSEYIPRVAAKYFLTMFQELKQQMSVIRLCITGTNLCWNCVIEDFSYKEEGGDIGTYYYSVKFRVYREVKIDKINVNSATGKATIPKKTESRVNTRTVPKTYTTTREESCYQVARKMWCDGSKGVKIYNANKAVIGPNPNIIPKGTTLTIPNA